MIFNKLEEGKDTMFDKIPNTEEMTTLVGKSLYEIWNKLCEVIDEKYDMDCLWNKGGKSWVYEYKYRRGGKTLCTLYAREKCVGFMDDEAKTYHDGKWIMFEPVDTSLFDDFMRLLSIKRKPNRK